MAALPIIPIAIGVAALALLATGGKAKAKKPKAPTPKAPSAGPLRPPVTAVPRFPGTAPPPYQRPTGPLPPALIVEPPPPPPPPGASAAELEQQARETAETIARAIQTGSADGMRALAHALEAQGNTAAAAKLRQAAIAIEREEVTEAARQAAAYAAQQLEIAQRAAAEAIAATTQREKDAAAEAARIAAAKAMAAQKLAVQEAAAALAAEKEEERQRAAAAALAAQEEAAREAAKVIDIVLPEVIITQPDPKKLLAVEVTQHLGVGPLTGEVRRGYEDKELVKSFQRATGATADGLYGPGTGGKVAALGVVPSRPFYFSRYADKARRDKIAWTESMKGFAAADPARGAAWLAAGEVARL